MTPSGRPDGLQAWMDLCELVDAVRIVVSRDLQAGVGLSLAENLTLCQVAMAPDSRLRMVDIAARLHIGKSAVTKMVDRLEQRGLLVREHDPRDRRTIYASLTDLGEKTFAAARPAFVAAVGRHFSDHLTAAELGHLRRALDHARAGRRSTTSVDSP